MSKQTTYKMEVKLKHLERSELWEEEEEYEKK